MCLGRPLNFASRTLASPQKPSMPLMWTARARLDKMIAGNRPEEIAQAEAQVTQAKALADRVRAEVESSRTKKKEARTNASIV